MDKIKKEKQIWYYYCLDEIKKISRVMTDKQIAKHYDKNISDIEMILYKILKINKKERINNLDKNEVIQIYNYLLNNERDLVPKNFFDNDFYVKILLEYLIKDILKWNRRTFIDSFSTQTLNENRLYSIRKTRNFNVIVNIISNIFNWDIKMWEMKKSNSGKDFWLNETNVNEALMWLKNKLQKDKNINNIYDVYHYGLIKAVSEYYLKGLLKIKYKNNLFNLYNDMYNETFDLNHYNNNYCCFKINTKPISLNYNNDIYKLTNKYFESNDIQKTLINEIIKYCEVNKKFPTAHDLNVSSGYISYAHMKKYFNKYSDIYFYILPLKGMVNHCWEHKENRITYIKYYCEYKCEESILMNINSTELLKKWTIKYFNQDIICREMSWGSDYTPKIYELLIEAYPQIKEQKLLFDWEWKSFYPEDNQKRIQILKELILYRLNNVIRDLYIDIPKYLNFSFMDTVYPKFNVMIRKGKFKDYYEWACLAFPEYKDKWNKKDFGFIIAKDNTILSSFQEKQIYEFIKYDLDLKYIKYIGKKRKTQYTYSLEDVSEGYKTTCPDYVIEYIEFNNRKIKLNKPIIIEYYGYYNPNNPYYVFVEYMEKMKIKNKFYNSNINIIFIDLYPNDLKNNLQGIRNKLNKVLLNLKECA